MVSSSSTEDEDEYETTIMRAFHEDVESAMEHVLNFKGSTKGHRVLNRHRTHGI